MNGPQDSNLAIALSAAVPLWILELKAKGGPDDADLRAATEFSQVLGEKGDVMLFRGGKAGEARDLFNRFAKCVAVMSFFPGGVKVFGERYESKV